MPRRNHPLPFIADHQLFVLQPQRQDATVDEQRKWLLPETFRWRRDAGRFGKPPDGLPDSWAWEVVADRTAFLSDLEPRLRAITVNAGCGKTVAAWQTQYLLQQIHSDHLCLLVNFSELPVRCGEIWNDNAEQSLLVDLFRETEATKVAPRAEVARLIAQKIHAGKFTLIVEAFDQTTAGKPVKDQASALQKFLEINRTVRCVCTGRPHAIVDQFWQSLFAHDIWRFVQIDVFNKQQAEQFVGSDRWKLCQRLDATELFVPRSLEAIRHIRKDKLYGIRTASQVYWRSLLHTFEVDRITQSSDKFRSPDGSWEIKKHNALQLFALLGFECNRQGFLDGVHSGEPFRTFFNELFRRHKSYLNEEYGITNKPALEATFTILARLNAAIDFAALDHDGITQLIFQNRTLQDFFAAIWMCTHASDADVEWFSENRFVRWKKSTETHYQMWKLTTEMPAESEGQMIARIDKVYVNVVGVLYEPSTANEPAVRSTEMIWRSWPALEEISRLKDLSGKPTETAVQAQNTLDAFLQEYRAILNDGSGGPAAQQICSDFESWFEPIDPNAAGWTDGEEDENGEPLPIVDRPYRMAKYTLTNELFALFAPDLRERYVAKGKEWRVDFSQYKLRPRVPVVAVDWYDAWCVSKWLGSELPGELEWEYACRAGQRTNYSVGNGKTLTRADARFGLKIGALAAEVDAFAVGNAWGLYQMHGNVLEWCANWYAVDEASRCLRGGSFSSDPGHCRSARRYGSGPASSRSFVGVRVSRAASD